MTRPPARPTRRRFITLTATGVAVAPFANALLSANAEAADMVKESDPAAFKLKYKADAAKARERKDPAAFCDNCTLYTGKENNPSGTCAALADKLVAAKGWCTAWESF
jgi:High potential iron-sulfur protein